MQLFLSSSQVWPQLSHHHICHQRRRSHRRKRECLRPMFPVGLQQGRDRESNDALVADLWGILMLSRSSQRWDCYWKTSRGASSLFRDGEPSLMLRTMIFFSSIPLIKDKERERFCVSHRSCRGFPPSCRYQLTRRRPSDKVDMPSGELCLIVVMTPKYVYDVVRHAVGHSGFLIVGGGCNFSPCSAQIQWSESGQTLLDPQMLKVLLQ